MNEIELKLSFDPTKELLETPVNGRTMMSFWNYFNNLTSVGGGEKIDDYIEAFKIPLWPEDLSVAIGIDSRFAEHFRRVIQIAIWATGDEADLERLIAERDTEGLEINPDDLNKIRQTIEHIRSELTFHLSEFIKETTLVLNPVFVLPDSDDEFYEQFAHHLVRVLALYHDIGKRVSIPRHQDEGYFHLRNVISNDDKKRLKPLISPIRITRADNADDERLRDAERRIQSELWDVFLMVIRYHDCAGSLGTGEASLGLLIDALSYQTKSLEKQLSIAFLIYFTNILDISASIGKTGNKLNERGGMQLEKINNLCNDLTIFKRILTDSADNPTESTKTFASSPSASTAVAPSPCGRGGYIYINKRKLEEEILRFEKTEHRCIGRIGRLLREAAPTGLKERLYDGVIKEAIVGGVGHTNIPEFSRRLGSLTRLDYMLSFVQWLLRYPEKIWASLIDNVSTSRVRELIRKRALSELDRQPDRIARLNEFFVNEASNWLKHQLLELFSIAGVYSDKPQKWAALERTVLNPGGADLSIDEKARILQQLARMCSEYNYANLNATLDNIAREVCDRKRGERRQPIEDALRQIETAKGLNTFIGELEDFTSSKYREEYGSIIPPDRQNILRQWFVDSKLVDHYLYSDNEKCDPVFMSTHVVAILWHIIQKYPPQHKHEEPQLSRMGISIRRLTDPDQIAERIVPLIVASGKPSHAYTWIEEEVTIWHYN